MTVAITVFGAVGGSSSGIRSFHAGSILTLRVSSSYWAMPSLERNWQNSASLSVEISVWAAISDTLCNAPSLRIMKNLSTSKFAHKCSIVIVHLRVAELVVEFVWVFVPRLFAQSFLEELLAKSVS
jgi:hypothetical protein